MAKVNRNMLKNIVKECLVEILAEGLSDGNIEELNESFSSSRSLKKTMSTNKRQEQQKVPNQSFEENTRKIISQTTNDPIMADILSDTAKTTLQEQNTADRPNRFTAKPTDTYSQIANESDPMEMFGGASNNWAALAFSDNKK
tara:strand:- start:1352 stop:1780 length:429 start_codon:yes stop_codon:yes gene_type:complete